MGSITKITTSTGGIVDEYSYTVFGKAYKKNPDGVYKPVSSLKSTIGNTRLYTGREYDRETNLYYLRARYYDANIGRLISRDPIGTKDNVNLYTYVANSPVMYTDRDGRKAKSITFSIYAERENGGLSEGHSWIEINHEGKTTSYGLFPKGVSIPIMSALEGEGGFRYIPTIEGVNINVENFYKKDIQYKNYVSLTTEISSTEYESLLKSIQSDVDNKITWGGKFSDYGVCSAWASDKWNEIVPDNLKLEDRNMFFISNPNTLAESILEKSIK